MTDINVGRKIILICFKKLLQNYANEHIDAHFSTCFLSLVLVRLLEVTLGNRFPAGRILQSLKNYNCTHLGGNKWQFTFYDEIMDACADAFNIRLNMKYRTQQEIRRLLRY